jgi:hypothetical protein
VSTQNAQIASLEAELSDARDEAELHLLLLQQVQEELNHYVQKCQQLQQNPQTADQAMALPLIDSLVLLDASGPAEHLQAIRLRLRLGQQQAAIAALEALITSVDDTALQHDARLLLSAVRLRQGDLGAAEAQLALVSDQAPDNAELQRQLRIAATLRQLATTGRDDLRPGHIGPEAVAAALDGVIASPCGTSLHLDGWFINPAAAVQQLVVLHGDQAWPIDLAHAVRRPRPDLGDLLTNAQLPADAPIGFRLTLLRSPEDRRPLPEPPPLVLLVLLHNGDQFCIACPVQLAPFDSEQARRRLHADLQANDQHHWSLAPWA